MFYSSEDCITFPFKDGNDIYLLLYYPPIKKLDRVKLVRGMAIPGNGVIYNKQVPNLVNIPTVETINQITVQDIARFNPNALISDLRAYLSNIISTSPGSLDVAVMHILACYTPDCYQHLPHLLYTLLYSPGGCQTIRDTFREITPCQIPNTSRSDLLDAATNQLTIIDHRAERRNAKDNTTSEIVNSGRHRGALLKIKTTGDTFGPRIITEDMYSKYNYAVQIVPEAINSDNLYLKLNDKSLVELKKNLIIFRLKCANEIKMAANKNLEDIDVLRAFTRLPKGASLKYKPYIIPALLYGSSAINNIKEYIHKYVAVDERIDRIVLTCVNEIRLERFKDCDNFFLYRRVIASRVSPKLKQEGIILSFAGDVERLVQASIGSAHLGSMRYEYKSNDYVHYIFRDSLEKALSKFTYQP